MNPSYNNLQQWLQKPALFESPVVDYIWNDPWIASKMLEQQTDGANNLVSRNTSFTEKSASWMIKYLELQPGSEVCDLGCGAGHYTKAFAQKKYQVTGVDISTCAIGYASEQESAKQYGIRYQCCDYLKGIPGGPFNLITLLYYDYCAFSPEQRKQLLQNIRDKLAYKGTLIMDVLSDARFRSLTESSSLKFSETDGLWSPLPHFNLKMLFTYPQEMVFLDKNVIVTDAGNKEYLSWYCCFSPETIAGELQNAGLRVRSVFSDIAGTPYSPDSHEIAVVAEHL
ncbi:MAG: methyltransferase domain-containing protein [Bacteroidales bacterium]|nr:methyltransferase domain-containing protein [Bacteroidales bacterium]